MRLTNEFIVLDLEATSNQETEEERPAIQTNNDIIEIGAVVVSTNLEITDFFHSLVKPTERITPFIEKLTGVTNEKVENEKGWKEVSYSFVEWVRNNCKNIKNARLCAWGNYFDMPLLRKSYRDSGITFPFSGTCFDIKTLAMFWCALSGRRTDKLSVEKIAEIMGITPEGRYHSAIVDAKVEAKIFIRIMEVLRDGHFLAEKEKPYRYIKIG